MGKFSEINWAYFFCTLFRIENNLNSSDFQNLGYVHLSAGDLLRAERERAGSEYGALIEGHIKNGSIVPVEITCALLENVSQLRIRFTIQTIQNIFHILNFYQSFNFASGHDR